MEKFIKPHCQVCMKEFNKGQEVIMDKILKGILHAECSYLPLIEIEDQGLIEEVIARNQRWFKHFNFMIIH